MKIKQAFVPAGGVGARFWPSGLFKKILGKSRYDGALDIEILDFREALNGFKKLEKLGY